METQQRNTTFNIGGKLRFVSQPCVMGIVNVTPDSFYAGSRVNEPDALIERCRQMLENGAAIIDLGAESTRPGSSGPGVDEEIKRLMHVFPVLRKAFPQALFSIDTRHAVVADALLNAGADIINDISGGLHDPAMTDVVAAAHVPFVVMHMRGTPENMQQMTNYTDPVAEINRWFSERIEALHQKGIYDLILDPGFGFAKTIDQNFTLLKHFEQFTFHEVPVLAGLSRKSMIYKTLGCAPEDALPGTMVLNTIALQKGAAMLRVHDVHEAMQCIALCNKLEAS